MAAVYKIKRFSQQAMSPNLLAEKIRTENIRQQRLLNSTRLQREKQNQQQANNKMRIQMQAQKLEQKREMDTDKKVMQAQKMSNNRTKGNESMPPSLVKTRTKAAEPISVNK